MRLVVLSLACAVLIPGCAGDSDGGEVVIDGRSFDPTPISIQVGESVTWTNEADEPHTVTAYESSVPEGGNYFSSGAFDSEAAARDGVAAGLLGAGDSVSVEFDASGTYEYFCIPHEDQGMKGTVVVEG